MKKLIIFLTIVLGAYFANSQQVYPFDMQVQGDVQVDSLLKLKSVAVSTSDSVLVRDGFSVAYKLITGGGLTVTNNGDNAILTATGKTDTINGESQLSFNGNALIMYKESGEMNINNKIYSSSMMFKPKLSFAKYNGTISSYAALTTYHRLGRIAWGGSYSISAVNDGAAYIDVKARENWSGTANGTQMDFGITPVGSTTTKVALSLYDDGITMFTGINDTTPEYTLDVSGKMRVTDSTFFDSPVVFSDTAIITAPSWREWSPTFTWTGGNLTIADTVARYMQDGNIVFFHITIWGSNTSGSDNTAFRITPPVTPWNTTNNKMFQPVVSCLLNQDGNNPHNGTSGAQPWGAYINMDDTYTSLIIYNTTSYSIANGASFYISLSGN
ncbi:MAG: hypothetical protein RQ760_16510, partial [Sedimentisphaerales bacterium]|nr:hypothetical protein [Sedimentisphaerales bacterium]